MRGLWLLYTLIGFGAFNISFLLQGWVFLNITDMFWFSFGTTCVFESAKVVTIILHRFMTVKNGKTVPLVLMGLTQAFKIRLVLLSIVCSLAMITKKNYCGYGINTLEPEAEERARDVQFTEDAIRVDLFNEGTISVPLASYLRLLHAKPEQRRNWKIGGAGFDIH
jgi:hypothetical protein